MNKVNQYSFRNIRKEKLLPSSLRKSLEDGKEFLEDNEEIIPDAMVYELNDNKVVEEYLFKDGAATLYCDNGDGTFAKIFDSQKSGNAYVYTIYRPNGIYAMEAENRHITYAFYMTARDFEKYGDMQNKISKIPYSIREFITDSFFNMSAVPIVEKGRVIGKFASYYETLKALFMKYYMASEYIPASVIINNISGILNHYIATGKLRKIELIDNWVKLGHFQQLCSSPYGKIRAFVSDPTHVDLRELAETLQKSSRNISNLLDMYLQEELER